MISPEALYVVSPDKISQTLRFGRIYNGYDFVNAHEA